MSHSWQCTPTTCASNTPVHVRLSFDAVHCANVSARAYVCADRDRCNVDRFIIFIYVFLFFFAFPSASCSSPSPPSCCPLQRAPRNIIIILSITKGHTPCQLNSLPPLDGVIIRSVCIFVLVRFLTHSTALDVFFFFFCRLCRLCRCTRWRARAHNMCDCRRSRTHHCRKIFFCAHAHKNAAARIEMQNERENETEEKHSGTDHDYHVSNRPRN